MTEEIRQIIIAKTDELFEKAENYENIAAMVAKGEREKDGYRYISEPCHYIGISAGLKQAAIAVLKLKQELNLEGK